MARLPDISDIPSAHLKLPLIVSVRAGVEYVRIFCICGHCPAIPIYPLIAKYGEEVTYSHIERLARCSKCGGRKGLDARPVFTAKIGNSFYST